jgi:hypothetical protein
VIALGLMAMLLTFLFNSIASGAKVDAKIESARSTLFSRQHLQARIQDLLLSLNYGQMPPLYTQQFAGEKAKSLVLSFDQGIDPDPTFSGILLGRIYIDDKKNLTLALWPNEKRGENIPWRKELLLTSVDDFHFEFLGKHVDKESRAITTHLGWHSQWPKKRLEAPSMVRLFITQGQTQLKFAFSLSSSEPFVTYWEGA